MIILAILTYESAFLHFYLLLLSTALKFLLAHLCAGESILDQSLVIWDSSKTYIWELHTFLFGKPAFLVLKELNTMANKAPKLVIRRNTMVNSFYHVKTSNILSWLSLFTLSDPILSVFSLNVSTFLAPFRSLILKFGLV